MQVQENNKRLKIFCDEFVESPRDWDNVGTMVCWHKRYAIGDKHDFSDPQEFEESEEAKSAYIILPIYLYDHSMQKISNSSFNGRAQHADWDSGQIGYVYVAKEKVKELTGLEPNEENKKAVQEILTAETEIYSSYIEGDCYGFTIEDLQGNVLDNCGGFFGGDMSEVLSAMKKHVGTEHEPLFTKMQSNVKTLYSAMT